MERDARETGGVAENASDDEAVRFARYGRVVALLSAACRIHPELSIRKGGCGYSLGTLVDSFGLDAENSHRADEDADACVKLFFRLMDDLNAVAPGREQAAVACYRCGDEIL